LKIRAMARAALFAAVTVLCAWISISLPPLRFTLQTLALMCCLGLLGGKWGCVSIGLYLLLGAAGLPVFSGFRGGLGAFADPAGGFLWGFLLGGLGYWAAEKLGRLPGLGVFLLTVYSCGTFWFLLYTPDATLGAAFLSAVAPYLLPEAVKLWLAAFLIRKIGKRL